MVNCKSCQNESLFTGKQRDLEYFITSLSLSPIPARCIKYFSKPFLPSDPNKIKDPKHFKLGEIINITNNIVKSDKMSGANLSFYVVYILKVMFKSFLYQAFCLKCIFHWGIDSLPVTNCSTKEMLLSVPHQLSTVSSSLVKSGALEASPSYVLVFWLAYSCARPCIGNQRCYSWFVH